MTFICALQSVMQQGINGAGFGAYGNGVYCWPKGNVIHSIHALKISVAYQIFLKNFQTIWQ